MGSQASTDTIASLVEGLGLKPYDQELCFGKLHGFPIGLKFIGSGETLSLLFQIRHPLAAAATAGRNLDYGAEVDGLIQANKIEISLEDKMAWLTIPDAEPFIESNSVPRIVGAVLATLEKAGFAGEPDKCHYCQTQTVEALTCENGKVAQICPACLEGKKKSLAADLSVSSVSLTAVIGMGVFASLVGAVAWMLVWIGYDALVNHLNARVIVIPRLVTVILIAMVAFLVGGPVGFIIKRIPRRGDLLAAWAGIIFSILSVILGEIVLLVWAIYGQYKVISFSAAIQTLPRYWIDNNWFYMAMKIVTAIISVFLAYQMARPRVRGVKL